LAQAIRRGSARAESWSYNNACSGGGRHGLTSARRRAGAEASADRCVSRDQREGRSHAADLSFRTSGQIPRRRRHQRRRELLVRGGGPV